MSFREVRNFTEILKTLGYRRLISLENFRQPNFHLIADILVWLVKRLDADYNISDDCSTSEFRVLLIRSVTEFMLLKTGLKLNMKKLYQADGHAVKEMLKIATLLHNALKIKRSTNEDFRSIANVDLSTKIQELKLTRELAIQITQKGSSLFELLSKEPALRESRVIQASTYVDINEVETQIKNAIDETNKTAAQVKQQIENISTTESNLDMKISKKENDIERIRKRLETLKRVKPAFLDEYERYEDELNQIYDSYVIKFRCYTYLQQQLQQLHNSQPTITNPNENDQDDLNDKMQSLLDDGSLSSPSQSPSETPANKPDPVPTTKKPVIGRIRTAIDSRASKSGNRMYGNAKEDSDDLDDDDDDDDDDELLDGDSILNNNDTDDESELQPSDTEKMNDDKSDDTF